MKPITKFRWCSWAAALLVSSIVVVEVAAATGLDSDNGGGGELRKFRLRWYCWSCRRALPRPRSEPPLPLPNEDGVEEDDSESGVADDVGEVDDESLILLSIAGDGAASAAPLELCTFIRIHLGTEFANIGAALFLKTITLFFLIAFVFSSSSVLLFSVYHLLKLVSGVLPVLHFTSASSHHNVASSHFANCFNLTLL